MGFVNVNICIVKEMVMFLVKEFLSLISTSLLNSMHLKKLNLVICIFYNTNVIYSTRNKDRLMLSWRIFKGYQESRARNRRYLYHSRGSKVC